MPKKEFGLKSNESVGKLFMFAISNNFMNFLQASGTGDGFHQNSSYTLYLEHLGGFLPLLKGRKVSKIKPEFVIYDPQLTGENIAFLICWVRGRWLPDVASMLLFDTFLN